MDFSDIVGQTLDDKPKTRWQKRIQKRLMQSGKITDRTSRI